MIDYKMGVVQKMIARLLGHKNTGAREQYMHIMVAETQLLVDKWWWRLVGDFKAN